MKRVVHALIVVSLVAGAGTGGGPSPSGVGAEATPLIDADVVSQLAGGSRARVLVELRVDEPGDPRGRDDAIARAQNAVLSRLPHGHSLLVRRYTSVPLLALEIDAAALSALQAMTGIVDAVKPDRPLRSQ
jgi:hypothetical protein